MGDSKTIDTLVQDIYSLLGSGVDVSDEDVDRLAKAMAVHVRNAIAKRPPSVGLRASQLGTVCDRKTWYNEHSLEAQREELQPWVRLKFLFGHLHEELVLWFAEQAGHKVTHRQDTVKVGSVEGHPDAIIDGCIVDVKSANSRGMVKFRKNALREDDPFGYIKQLEFYYTALVDELGDKDNIYFLACDKEMGHLVLDKYGVSRGPTVLNTVKHITHKEAVVSSQDEPPRHYMPIPDGKSGNMQLDLPCRYCEHKATCWPNLRTFLYSNGPRYLTRVAKTPDVPEITKDNTDEIETDVSD